MLDLLHAKAFLRHVAEYYSNGRRVAKVLPVFIRSEMSTYELIEHLPLKDGSSSRGRLWLFSPLVSAAAARLSWARRSKPRTDARGVGGGIGLAGVLNVCCCSRRLS